MKGLQAETDWYEVCHPVYMCEIANVIFNNKSREIMFNELLEDKQYFRDLVGIRFWNCIVRMSSNENEMPMQLYHESMLTKS